MNQFLILRGLWWLVALLLLVTHLCFGYDSGQPWLVATLGVLALLAWWAVYLLRAWVLLAVLAGFLVRSVAVPAPLSCGLIAVAISGVLILWIEYLRSFHQTKDARLKRQAKLLAESNRPKTGVPTVLILTASDGFGHLIAAETWSKRLMEYNVVCIDVFALLSPWQKRLWQSWEYLAVYVPEVHSLVHMLALLSPNFVSRVVAEHLAKRLPVTEEVSQVVTTHPLAAVVARRLLGKEHMQVRGTLVCTDFFVNPQALDFAFHAVMLPRDLTDSYTAAPTSERDALWAELLLDPQRPTTLVLTGGSGLLPFEKVFKLVRWLETCIGHTNRQFVLTCGTNEWFYEWATRKLACVPNVRVVRFVTDLNRFYSHFDTVVCKAGGLTTAELLATDRPRIAVWYAYRGQERSNLRFLKAWGANYTPSFFKTALTSWLKASR